MPSLRSLLSTVPARRWRVSGRVWHRVSFDAETSTTALALWMGNTWWRRHQRSPSPSSSLTTGASSPLCCWPSSKQITILVCQYGCLRLWLWWRNFHANIQCEAIEDGWGGFLDSECLPGTDCWIPTSWLEMLHFPCRSGWWSPSHREDWPCQSGTSSTNSL